MFGQRARRGVAWPEMAMERRMKTLWHLVIAIMTLSSFRLLSAAVIKTGDKVSSSSQPYFLQAEERLYSSQPTSKIYMHMYVAV